MRPTRNIVPLSQIVPKLRDSRRVRLLTAVIAVGALGSGVAFSQALSPTQRPVAAPAPTQTPLSLEEQLLADIVANDHGHDHDHDHAQDTVADPVAEAAPDAAPDDHGHDHDHDHAAEVASSTRPTSTPPTTQPKTAAPTTTTTPTPTTVPQEIIDVEQLAGTDESLPTPEFWTIQEIESFGASSVATQSSVAVATPQSVAFAQRRDEAILTTARAIGGLPANPLGASCPAEQYQIRWETPTRIFQSGDYVGQIRPPAPMEPTAVGVVVCGNSTYAFRGFVAVFNGVRWEVSMVWSRLRSQSRPDLGLVVARGYGASNGVDGFPLNASQTTCDPTTKPGVAAFRSMVMAQRGGRDGGIVRNCNIGGRSEHKEGRAWDWMMNANDPNQRAVADQFMAELTATDANGEVAALARRYGIYYIIWNRQIWTTYSASSGWRPYSGVSPHTDHVHFSFTWDGAMGRTSGFTGVARPGLLQESEPLPNENPLTLLPGQRQSPAVG